MQRFFNQRTSTLNGGYQPNLQIPALPIIPTQTQQQVVQALQKAIIDEATTIDFYGRIAQMAPTDFSRQTILGIVADEQSHLAAFSKLYVYLTGNNPVYNIEPILFSNYSEAIFMAFNDELEAADFYKKNILSTSDQLIQDTYFYAMVDEQEHAIQFLFLYNNS